MQAPESIRFELPRNRLVIVGVLLALVVSSCADEGSTPDVQRFAAPDRSSMDSSAGSPRADGSLGDANTKRACTLLTGSEIEAQFGGPVGEATPVYPYCQWLVGEDSFLAVTVFGSPLEEVRATNEVRFEVGGIGEGAFVASTRALFFGFEGESYSILWQRVGDFTTVERDRLGALARAVLERL